MLSFMRKHQKYFFIVITIVIVVSFSFFGTYSTIAGNSIHEQTAFKTVNGKNITRLELEQMTLFIGTDNQDKKNFGGVSGPNFLNDGVVQKDFLETGLASMLIEAFPTDVTEDLNRRFVKERHYQPYVHPQAQYISSLNVWSYFAPPIASNLQMLKNAADPMNQEAMQARISLYLAERRLPAAYLNQILRYQEKQHGQVAHDEALDRLDLSLFGYHTLEDWFGSHFNRLIAQFIFNASAIAEQKGYHVSKEEALASLMRQAELSFQENQDNPYLGVTSVSQYIDQQLMRMHMDRNQAVKLWQKVMLFRRLFNDVGQSMVVDHLAYSQFNQYANETVKGELFRLQPGLRISDFPTLQRFEIYLDAVAKRSKDPQQLLELPHTFLSVQDISGKTPELVRKRYELELASVNKQQLQTKVSVRDTIQWELEERNWPAITVHFPELGLQQTKTSEERLAAIDRLDSLTRSRLEQFAREQIVNTHPEWVTAALEEAPMQNLSVSLSSRGPSPIFVGLDHGENLIKQLDQVELNQDVKELQAVSFDDHTFYRIKVIERSPDWEIMTFEEANQSNLLDELLKRALEIHYVQIRTQDPGLYQTMDKSWKPLESVQHTVALSYFSKTLDAIKSQLNQREDKEKYHNITGERLAAYRFVSGAEKLRLALEKDPAQKDLLTISSEHLLQNLSHLPSSLNGSVLLWRCLENWRISSIKHHCFFHCFQRHGHK